MTFFDWLNLHPWLFLFYLIIILAFIEDIYNIKRRK